MNELNELVRALRQREPLVAMVAPSFPIVFPFPALVSMLRRLGFAYVVEVALGAERTNAELVAALQSNPTARYITSPCPSVVRLIRQQLPEYAQYFPPAVDSPMAATAKIVREKYPGHRPVFIGPCIVKKLEASQDVPELDILVVTYDELNRIFTACSLPVTAEPGDDFDLKATGPTRFYPMDGGLAYTSGAFAQLGSEAVQIVSGWQNCTAAIKSFTTNTQVRLLDILFCEGGCISGLGIKSSLLMAERQQKIKDYVFTSSGQK